MHYFAWFEGFGGEEAAAGAFDVRFADLDVHFLVVFCFFFCFFLQFGLGEDSGVLFHLDRFGIGILGVALQGLFALFRGTREVLFTKTISLQHTSVHAKVCIL